MALAGIPIPETQCIGDSLDTINNAFQALDTAVAAAAGAGVTQIVAGSNISISPTGGTGVVTINGSASYTLPCRLGENSCTITNWNDAITNGWYMGSDATNAPGAGWYMGYVQAHNAGWTTQIIHQFAGNNSTWIREQDNSVWGSWTPYGGASVTVSDTPPSGASAGDLWFDSSSGVTSVYYDGTWVDVGGGDSGTSAGSVNGIVKSDGSGNFSAAVAGTDYLTSATLGSSPATAKAWVNFDGTTSPGTIRSSYNVSSVTKNGTGDYTVTFATPMANANYSIASAALQTSSNDYRFALIGCAPINASQIKVVTGFANALSPTDFEQNGVVVFGN